MQKLTISVALPVYNSQNYIVTQLESIINQTEKPDEIIVCDDKSTDNTVKEIYKLIDRSELAKKKIQLFLNPKRYGMDLNFQEAISKCKGDIIFLSDSDDYWFKNKIKYMKETIIKNNLLIAINDCRFTDINLKPFKVKKINQIKKIFNNTDNFIPGCCTVFKKELLKYYLPIPNHNTSYDTWLHFTGNFIQKRKVINKVFQLYRRHKNNNTNALFNQVEPINILMKIIIQFKIFFQAILSRKKILKKNIKNYEVLKNRLIKYDKKKYNQQIQECNKILEKLYKREMILNNYFLVRLYKIFLLKNNKVLWKGNRAKLLDLFCLN